MKLLDEPAVWTASEIMAGQAEWVYTLTQDDVSEIDAALQLQRHTDKILVRRRM